MESKETPEDLYTKICDINNLFLAFEKAKKGKTKRRYVKRFQRNLKGIIGREKAIQSLEGWLAYCSHANTFKYRKYLIRDFNRYFSRGKKKFIYNKSKYVNYIRKVNESELEFSVQKTLLHFRKGFSIKEISIKEGIKEATVWGHLINLIEHRQLSVWQVVSVDKANKIFKKIYSPKERLRDIKKRIKDNSITYDEIACVMASIKSKRKFKKKKKRPVNPTN